MNEDEIQINVEPVADGIMLQPSGDIDLAWPALRRAD